MYTQAMDLPGQAEANATSDTEGLAASSARFEATIDADGPTTTARRWCARSVNTRTARWSVCCPRATGSAAPPA